MLLTMTVGNKEIVYGVTGATNPNYEITKLISEYKDEFIKASMKKAIEKNNKALEKLAKN